MAEVYRRVESGPKRGLLVTALVSHHGETQDGVKHYADIVGGRAEAILRSRAGHAPHTDPADNTPSQITVERPRTTGALQGSQSFDRHADSDWLVILNDERGMGAAMTIEYGMRPGIDTEGYFYPGTEPVAPLRKAAGLPIRPRKTSRINRQPNRRSRRWKLR